MTRLVSYALVTLVGLGLAYAVATMVGKAIGDSFYQSAALIEGASSGR